MLASSRNRRDTAFRLLSAMPFQRVLALQPHPNARVGNFATQCTQAVLDVQRDILNIIWTFRRTPALSDSNGPVRMVISHVVPEWYLHRTSGDVTFLSQRLMHMLGNRAHALAAPLPLTAAQPSQSVLQPSAIVPYAPIAAAMRQMAGILCRRNRRAEEAVAENPSKKSRRD